MTLPRSARASRNTADLRVSDLNFASFVRPGDRLVVSQMAGEPLALTEALVAQREQLADIEIFVGVLNETAFAADATNGLRFRSFGAMGNARALSAAGRLEIVPVSLGQIAGAIADGRLGCDVALLQLSPTDDPDQFGFGPTCDYMRAAIDRARIVIGEVNLAAPRILGTERVHRSEIDVLVRTDRPLGQEASRPPTALDRRIADHVGELVEDGTTLQVGIGGVPDAVMARLDDRRDLGYHAGLLGDGVATLIRRGIITNAHKTTDPGVSVAAMISGSRALMDFVSGNASISLRSSSYTNAIPVIASQDRFLAINSALEVDLCGATNAEAIDGRQIGGIGGLPDFVIGASIARRGRSIIALPATSNGGGSRIVPRLHGPTTLAAHLADIVITEFGRAELRGKSFAQRARALIAVSAPELRDMLTKDARNAGLFA